MNWYYCNDGKTVIGPLSDEAIDALHRCGTINDETPIVAEGSTDWKTFGEAIKVNSSGARKEAPITGTAEPDRRTAAIPPSSANKTYNTGLVSILKWMGSHKKVVVVGLLLTWALGAKIHSKIERERAGREFRERAIARDKGRNSSPEDYFASETANMKRKLQESGDIVGNLYRIPCDRCDGHGQIPYNCGECGGNGVLVRGSGTELTCPGCAGRGRVGRTCSKCDGEGKVLSEKPY